MATVTILNLPATNTVDATTVAPVVYSGTTYKATLTTLGAFINTNAAAVSASGNITAGNFFIGNGSQLTGVVATGIGTLASLSVTGNITAGNVNTSIVSATGNVVGSNVNTGIVSATGNISGANLILSANSKIGVGTSTPDSAVSILAVSQTVLYPITGNSTALGTDLHISGTDSTITRITQDAFGTSNYPAFTGRSARGTAGTPAQTLNNDIISQFTGRGFSNGSLQFGNVSTGRLDIEAAEDFTDTSRATKVIVYTTPVGAILPVATAKFESTGAFSATGNITGSYFLGNGSQLTGIDATSIQNGTSNVRVVSSGGNVTVGIGGTGNVAVFATTGAYVTGEISASGNITGGNILGGANVNATTHTGTTVSMSGNITGGNLVTGAAVSAASVSASGNVTGGNIITSAAISAASVSASGNITGGNILGGANVNATTHTGTTVSMSGNITGGNIVTSGAVSAASVSASGNITGGNVNVGNITIATDLIFSANSVITIDPATIGNAGLVVINGNLQVNGTTTTINSNVVTTNDLVYTVANNAINGAAANGGGYEVGPFGNAFITWLYNDSGNTWVSSGGISAVGNVVGGNLITSAAISAASVSASGNITGGNILGGANVNATTHTGSTVSVTGNITGGNILGGANVNATTHTGTTVSVSGNITGGNVITGGALSAASLSLSGASQAASYSAGTGNITGGNIVNANGNGVGNIGSSTVYFNTVFAKATSAQYADLAEKYTADAEYASGTVLSFGGAQEVTVTLIDADHRVAGVVSTNPATIMNAGLVSEHVATVALTGRVPCSVTGTVRKGDSMVSAGNGVARAEANPAISTVLGKSLEDFDGESGMIEIVVGRV